MLAGMTIEDSEFEYQNKDADDRYYQLQSALGSEEDAARAIDEDGNYHCIVPFSC